ncbi:MAG TPA: LemA family protein [Pirellulales bacterium]|jgi:LemA protein|nr:LemA family protein [Pirellulales bacterium]
MKPLQLLAFFFIALLAIAVLGGGCVFMGYNRAISMDEAVKNNWSQVENQLQRRYDLIPNLVATVKGTAGQEQAVFLGIANARKAYFQADTVADKARAATQVESALSRLLLLQEAYPQLKSNEAFLKLQDQIEGTENRLSVERERYNESVRALNTYVRQFPGTFFARLAGVREAEYFQIDKAARTAPKVDFSAPAGSGK